MTDTRKKARPASRWLGLMAVALAAGPGAARAQALDLFYERTVLRAADERCKLLAPEIATALAAGAAQARGAALRGGSTERAVRSLEAEALDRASRMRCASPELTGAALRMQEAFKGYSKIMRMTYPGDQSAWRADRAYARTPRWRLAQDARFGADRVTFGLAGQAAPGVLVAVVQFADGARPYGARLVMRDEARTLGPYLPSAGAPLAGRMPPGRSLRTFMAEARDLAPDELLPKESKGGWALRFPAAGAQALAELDPREAVAVEFLFPGERVRTAYIEVGDFAAGRAFVQIASR